MQARQQLAAVPMSETLAKILATPAPKIERFESWVEGSRGAVAALDSGIQLHKLKLLYWREHKVGWRRVRVVYGIEGTPARIIAFRQALAKWVAEMQQT